jgi:hypothetical protein
MGQRGRMADSGCSEEHFVDAWRAGIRSNVLPDFLLSLLASTHFMRLFLKKGAHAAWSSFVYRKFGAGVTHRSN